MTILENRLYTYMRNGNSAICAATAVDDFPGETEFSIRQALESLCRQGKIEKGHMLFGGTQMYQLPDNGWALADDAVPVSELLADNMPIMAEDFSPWPYEEGFDCKPLEKCTFSKPHPTHNEVCEWFEAISDHFEYVQAVKQGIANKKIESLQQAANLGLMDMQGVQAAFRQELQVLAKYRSMYFEKIDAVIRSGFLSSIEDPAKRKTAYNELLSLIDDNKVEEMTFNGSNRISVNVPKISEFRKHLKDAYLENGSSSQSKPKSKPSHSSANSAKPKTETSRPKVTQNEAEKHRDDTKRRGETQKKCDKLLDSYEAALKKQAETDKATFTDTRIADLKKEIEEAQAKLDSLGLFQFSEKKRTRRLLELLNKEVSNGSESDYIKLVLKHIDNAVFSAKNTYEKQLKEYMESRFAEKKIVVGQGKEPPRPKTRSELDLDDEESCVYFVLNHNVWMSVNEAREYMWGYAASSPFTYVSRLHRAGLLDCHDGKYAAPGTPYDITETYYVEDPKHKDQAPPQCPTVPSFLRDLPAAPDFEASIK